MRDLLGKWRVAEIMMFDEKSSDFVWEKVEDIVKKPDIDVEYLHSTKTIMDFESDKIYFLSPIPEGVTQEEIDEAVAEGELTIRDGMACPESYDWKIEDGKAYFNSGVEGEVLDEEVSPWVEIEEVGDMIEMLSFRLIKI